MFPLSKWHAVWVAVAVFVTVMAGATLHLRRATGPIRVTEAAPPARTTYAARAATALPTGREPLFVHVSGQVARPGLYRLPAGARVMDAVTGAGGATANADLDALNLATPLRDGQKLVIPGLGETPPRAGQDYLVDSPPPPAAILVRSDAAPTPPPMDSAGFASVAAPPNVNTVTPAAWRETSSASASAKLRNPGDGVVNINTAGETELQRLPGVGPSTARKIMDYRNAHGGFRTVEELMEVKGIGEKKMAKMRPFVTL